MRLLGLFLAVAAVVVADDATDEKDVLVLKESNFKETISENEFVLVEFYAPWCGHCKALAPEYAKAATALQEEGSAIKLAKVDATEETSLAEEHGVRGYPTLKFFRNGEASEYNGGRTSSEIINWLKKKTGPPAQAVTSVEDAKKLIDSKPVVVFGFFKDQESDSAKEYLAAATAMDDHPFAITSDDSVFSEYSATDGSVILFKDFDEKKDVFDGEFKKEELLKFVTANSLPLVVDFNHETASKIFSGEIKSHMLVFLSKEAGHYDKYLEVCTSVAKGYKGKLLFVTINVDEEDHNRILEFFGMTKEEVPGLRIIKLEEDMAKYKPDSYDITEENMRTTLDKFLSGELKQHLLSQDLPEDWDKNPVKILVSTNFDEIAFDKAKDVLVEFYAPWCGHCKQLAPIYDQLGEKFKERDDIVVAKMDATVNELEHTKIQSFPTLKLYKKEDNSVVDYGAAHTLEALTKFIESGGEVGQSATEYDDYDEEDDEEIDEEGEVPSKDEL